MARMDIVMVEGQPMRMYVDLPGGGAPRPGVIVMVHGPGLDRFIETQVEELARAGYAAAAFDVYHRQPTDDGADSMTRMSRLLDREILVDLDAAVAHFEALPEVRRDALAVIGFCMGGRTAYLIAGARPARWRAAGVFYGGNIRKAWGDGPTPFDLTAQIACPVIGIFGRDDTNPSPDDVAAIDAEMTRCGVRHEFHLYDDAGHAFLNFTNAQRHRPEAAAQAWQRLLAFLDRQFGAVS